MNLTNRDVRAIEAADVCSLSPDEQAAACAKGTRRLYDFADTSVVPLVKAALEKTGYEQAVAATYYRMVILLRGLVALDDPCHFQFANMAARTVFELLLDLKTLAADHSTSDKLFAFTDVSKFHKATQLVDFLDKNPSIDRKPHEHAEKFAIDPARKKRIEDLCDKHWGRIKTGKRKGELNWPTNWSGKDTCACARDAGITYEEIYRSQFFVQSYHVHAGVAGIDNLSRDALIRSFSIAHVLIQRLFAEATTVIGEEFDIFDADPEVRSNLKRAAAATGYYAVEAVLGKP